MDLAFRIAGFLATGVLLMFGALKMFDKKVVALNKEISEAMIKIAHLETTVNMLEKNMWDQTKLKALIVETSTETVKLAVAEFRIELLKLGIGVDKRNSGMKDI